MLRAQRDRRRGCDPRGRITQHDVLRELEILQEVLRVAPGRVHRGGHAVVVHGDGEGAQHANAHAVVDRGRRCRHDAVVRSERDLLLLEEGGDRRDTGLRADRLPVDVERDVGARVEGAHRSPVQTEGRPRHDQHDEQCPDRDTDVKAAMPPRPWPLALAVGLGLDEIRDVRQAVDLGERQPRRRVVRLRSSRRGGANRERCRCRDLGLQELVDRRHTRHVGHGEPARRWLGRGRWLGAGLRLGRVHREGVDGLVG